MFRFNCRTGQSEFAMKCDSALHRTPHLEVSQQAQTGRWSAGTEQLLRVVHVALPLWTHAGEVDRCTQTSSASLFFSGCTWCEKTILSSVLACDK